MNCIHIFISDYTYVYSINRICKIVICRSGKPSYSTSSCIYGCLLFCDYSIHDLPIHCSWNGCFDTLTRQCRHHQCHQCRLHHHHCQLEAQKREGRLSKSYLNQTHTAYRVITVLKCIALNCSIVMWFYI